MTAITDFAFQGCKNLKSINIPKSIKRIGSFAFAECTNLEEIIIPNGVSEIEGYTFRNCENLHNMYIPSSISSIGSVAFLNSPKGFNIYYEGTEIMWDNIKTADSYIDYYDPNIYFNCRDIYDVTIIMQIGSTSATISGKNKFNDVAPIIVNERTMLPARFVVENLGAKIIWYENEKKVEIKKDDTEIIIYIDSNKAFVNKKEVLLDSPAFIKDGRTYTPIRFISESLGAKVEWEQDDQLIKVSREIV